MNEITTYVHIAAGQGAHAAQTEKEGIVPDVQAGLSANENPGEIAPDPFEQALRGQVGGRQQSVEKPSAADQVGASGDQIRQFVAAEDDGSLTKDVQAGLRAGGPQDPGATELKSFDKVAIDGEEVSGDQVHQALEIAEGLSEQLDSDRSEEAVAAFLDAAEVAGRDGGLLAEAVADLGEAVDAGTVSEDDARALILESVLDVYGLDEDDLTDEVLQEQVDSAIAELLGLAFQIKGYHAGSSKIEGSWSLRRLFRPALGPVLITRPH